MKILFVLNLRPSKSGITEQILYLKKRFEDEKHEVKLVSTFGNLPDRFKSIINVIRAGNDSDLIIGAGCSYFGFYPIFTAALAAFFLNKKIIFNYHGGQAGKYFKKYNYFLKHVFNNNKIIVASDYLKNVFEKYGYNVIKIDNMFDFESFADVEDTYYDGKKVIWARSFEPLYQPELALEIAKSIIEKYECEFHFYGDGSLLDKLGDKYKNEKIIFHGLVNRKILLGEYKKFSVLLNTTLNDNIPNTIFEAGFNKLLVVSSKVGGIETTFTDKEILFVERNNLNEYVNALSEIFENPGNFTTIRENLYKKIIKYDWQNVRKEWLSILNEFS